jgi:chitin disaccharide deacetylase
MKSVIINADDLGISISTNLAINNAFQRGLLTSASLIVNMSAYTHAVEHVVRNNTNKGIGLHLILTEGRSVLNKSEIPLLVDNNGFFKNDFLSIYYKTKTNRDILKQIDVEINAQFEKAYSDGIIFDHVNAHHHVHMIPAVFDLVVKSAKKYQCSAVRFAYEQFPFPHRGWYPIYYCLPFVNGNIIKKIILNFFAKFIKNPNIDIFMPDYCFGILHSGCMDVRKFRYIFSCISEGTTEIIVHPGLQNSQIPDEMYALRTKAWLKSGARQVEYDALLDETLQHDITRNNIRLMRFRDACSASELKIP